MIPFHSILAQFKAEIIGTAIVAGIVTGIGLLCSAGTSPTAMAVLVYLADWNMLWTWQWWTRTIFYLVTGAIIFWLQKRKCNRQLLAVAADWQKRYDSLERQFNHSQLMLSQAQVRITVLERKR